MGACCSGTANPPSRVRFAYHSHVVRGVGTARYALIHRPMLPIRVIGPSGDETLLGLADTGADDTLLPDFLIGPLGVAIIPGDHAAIVGINGGTTIVRYGMVDLELS